MRAVERADGMDDVRTGDAKESKFTNIHQGVGGFRNTANTLRLVIFRASVEIGLQLCGRCRKSVVTVATE